VFKDGARYQPVAWWFTKRPRTAAEYRAMADKCFKWARNPYVDEARETYLQLAQFWLDVASKLDVARARRGAADRGDHSAGFPPGPMPAIGSAVASITFAWRSIICRSASLAGERSIT
jgi:hypothetical protein